jgi:peptidoglycan/LPS O-acetylase OafA/YrhL
LAHAGKETAAPISRSATNLFTPTEIVNMASTLEYKQGKHFPPLDGVRAIAFLLVLLAHSVDALGVHHIDKGFLVQAITFPLGEGGVRLFFILSGFLITSILLDAKQYTHYFKNFYARRALRILPLYYFYLILAFAILPLLIAVPWKDALVAKQILPFCFYTANNVEHIQWFQVPGQLALWDYPHIHHLWSLAIEEQFYLFWPLVVFLLNKRALKVLCIVTIAATPFVIFLYNITHGRVSGLAAVTYLHLDALCLGGLIACLATEERGAALLNRLTRPVFLVAGCLAISLLVLKKITGFHDTFQVLLCILNFLLASVLVSSLLSRNRTERALLSKRWLTRIGKYSYGLYVYHQIILRMIVTPAIMRIGLFSHHGMLLEVLVTAAFGLAITYVVAWVSWQIFEKQLLKLKRYFQYREEPKTEAQPAAIQEGIA